ncbi:MAG: pyridoxal-phosphate dependent enzyme [Lysobacterales bacterium]
MYVNTPLLCQPTTTGEVWLKMECDQPTGSFKIRGMSRLVQEAKDAGAAAIVGSSGGNAGLAVAYAAKKLALKCHVVVPQTTPELTLERLKSLGAQVRRSGIDWSESDRVARQLCNELGGVYAHPFDHPEIWAGHSSVIDECAASGLMPDAVVLAVGGGGLLCGVLTGMARAGWTGVPVFAVETHGAASLKAAMDAGGPVALDAIDTIAITMGARQVADRAWQWTQEHPVHSVLVSDAQALAGCRRFADDQRRLVEPACGAVVSAVYDGLIDARTPLVIACGGAGVTLEMLEQWRSVAV